MQIAKLDTIKIMKTSELMIDDWVSINGSNYQVSVLKKKGVIKLYDQTEHGIHEVEFNTDWLEEFITPIPITPEILLKNGLHQQENYFSCFVDENEHDFYSIKVEFAEEKKGAILRFNVEHVTKKEVLSSSQSTIGGKEYYVHELQHAIKSCKIEKEIIV